MVAVLLAWKISRRRDKLGPLSMLLITAARIPRWCCPPVRCSSWQLGLLSSRDLVSRLSGLAVKRPGRLSP